MPHIESCAIPTLPCWCTPIPDCVNVVGDTTDTPSLALGVLTLPGDLGTETIPYFDIISVVETCEAPAVAQVNTIAPSSFEVGTCCGNSTEYIIQISTPDCETNTEPWRYTFEATTDVTAADVVDSLVAQINASAIPVTAADGGSTMTLTADTAGCAFVIDYVSDNLVNIATTPNTIPVGQEANLLYDGVPAADFSSSATYHQVDITYRNFKSNPVGGCDNCLVPCVSLCRYYVINDATGDTYLSDLSTITTGADTSTKYLSKSGSLTGC